MGKVGEFFVKYPFFKGLTAYAILWPAANVFQQKLRGNPKIDVMEAVRYGAVGVTFVCPVYYAWLRFINTTVPGTNFQACMKKVVIEQLVYWPVAIPVFYAGRNFYDRRTFAQFVEELKEKYWKTHLSILCFWPVIGPIINYSNLIADHNRTPVAAVISFCWATYLSYMKELQIKKSD